MKNNKTGNLDEENYCKGDKRKAKHLKGKKKRFPWVWAKEIFFFAFQMLRLSRLAAQQLQEAH